METSMDHHSLHPPFQFPYCQLYPPIYSTHHFLTLDHHMFSRTIQCHTGHTHISKYTTSGLYPMKNNIVIAEGYYKHKIIYCSNAGHTTISWAKEKLTPLKPS